MSNITSKIISNNKCMSNIKSKCTTDNTSNNNIEANRKIKSDSNNQNRKVSMTIRSAIMITTNIDGAIDNQYQL